MQSPITLESPDSLLQAKSKNATFSDAVPGSVVIRITLEDRRVSAVSGPGKTIAAGSFTIILKSNGSTGEKVRSVIRMVTASIPGYGENIIPIIIIDNANVTTFFFFSYKNHIIFFNIFYDRIIILKFESHIS